MKIVLHAGVKCTDEERLLTTLRSNKDILAQRRVRLRNAFPDLPMFLWCNEDTPFIWGQIIRTLTNLPYPQKIRGDFDLYQDILPADAFARFQQYLETHPSMNVSQLKKVMFAFAERFALPDVMDEVIDAPNWTDTLIEKLTIIYDKDIEAIARIPKTQLLLP